MGTIVKLLLLIAVGLWLWYSPAVRRLWRSDSKQASPKPKLPERMVRCAHCGIHLPESDAVRSPEGQLYCSQAHHSRGARTGHYNDRHG